MTQNIHPTMAEALRSVTPAPTYPRHQACGVVHFESGWRVYWGGAIDEREFATRTQAIDELAARDRAERFCEAQT